MPSNNEIPAVFWMMIISVLSGLLAFILYHIGMLIKQSTVTVKEATETVKKSNVILDDAGEVVSLARDSAQSVKTAIDDVNQAIVVPAKSIGSALQGVMGFMNGLRGVDAEPSSEPKEAK